MTLAEWLKENDISALAFGKAMGWPHPRDAYRYADGRVPEPERMIAIHDFTGQQVTPNDFVLSQRDRITKPQ
jgi:hypothetical protein